MSATDWRERLLGRDAAGPGRGDRHLRDARSSCASRARSRRSVFAETRLRRGVYGQRYDNGQRHDGDRPSAARRIPPGDAHQGPGDAVGRARACSASRSRSAASRPTSSTCSPSWPRSTRTRILHVTTRQDIQLHFVHIEDTPDLMRRLAAVGITTREACGNSRAQRHRLPARRRLPRRGVRRHALRAAPRPLPARPPRRAGLRAQVQDRVLGLRRRGLRPGRRCTTSARSPRTHGRRRRERRGFELVRRRRPRRGAAPGEAARRVPPGEELLPTVAGDRARLRAPRREAEPRPRAHQVPGREARHRRVPAPRARGARDAAARRRAGRRTCRRRTTSTRRRCEPRRRARTARRAPRASTQWLRTNVCRQRQDGYAVGHRHPAARRPHRASRRAQLADIARTLRRRHDAHDGRAEHRAALGQRGATCRRSTPTLDGDRPRRRPAPARSSTSPPAPAPTPASSASPRRAAWPASCARASARRAVRAGRGRARPAHQGQRLLQLLRPAPRRRHRLLRRAAARSTAARCRTSRWSSAGSGRENAGSLRPGHRRGAVEEHPRGGRRASPTRFVARARRTARPSRTSSRASARRSCGAMLDELHDGARRTTRTRRYYTDWGDPREFTIGDMGIGECAGEVVSSTDLELSFGREHRLRRRRWRSRTATWPAPTSAPTPRCSPAPRALVRTENPNVPDDPDEIVERVQEALLRHRALLRPLRQGALRAAAVRPPRGAARGARGRGDPRPGRGGPALHRRRPRLRDPRGRRAVGAGVGRERPSTDRRHRPHRRQALRREPRGDRRRRLRPAVPRLDPAARASTASRSTSPTTSTSPTGPGIMLIGHEADRSLDFGEGRPGVVYQRKRDGRGHARGALRRRDRGRRPHRRRHRGRPGRGRRPRSAATRSCCGSTTGSAPPTTTPPSTRCGRRSTPPSAPSARGGTRRSRGSTTTRRAPSRSGCD